MFVLIYLHLSERSRSAFICHKFEEKCCWNPSSLRGVNIISWITCGSVTMFTISCLFISCGSVTILLYFLCLWNHASQQLLELSKPDFLPSLCNRALFVLISRAKCLPTPQKWVELPASFHDLVKFIWTLSWLFHAIANHELSRQQSYGDSRLRTLANCNDFPQQYSKWPYVWLRGINMKSYELRCHPFYRQSAGSCCLGVDTLRVYFTSDSKIGYFFLCKQHISCRQISVYQVQATKVVHSICDILGNFQKLSFIQWAWHVDLVWVLASATSEKR